ncbi:MAG: hypothetical protein RLZZ387_2757 [Chloroflexota bacterium]
MTGASSLRVWWGHGVLTPRALDGPVVLFLSAKGAAGIPAPSSPPQAGKLTIEAAPTAGVAVTHPIFTRDRFTWTAYLLLCYFSHVQALLGPSLPFLRAELGLGYLAGSLHLSAFAVGMALTGLLGEGVVRRPGFRRALWSGAAGMGVAIMLVAAGGHVAVAIAGSALVGALGTDLVTAQQASLSLSTARGGGLRSGRASGNTLRSALSARYSLSGTIATWSASR